MAVRTDAQQHQIQHRPLAILRDLLTRVSISAYSSSGPRRYDPPGKGGSAFCWAVCRLRRPGMDAAMEAARTC